MVKNKNKQDNHIPGITLGLSIASIYVALVAYASTTSFKSGYLAHFGIDIRSVDYWPTIADLMSEPLLVIGSIIILLILCLGAIELINGLYSIFQKLAQWREWKRLPSFFDEKPYDKGLTIGVLIVTLLFL